MPSPLHLALLSCLLLGLRHGFDYDHVAAIADITNVQRGWREGMQLGLLYALGHALTVAVLGIAVILFHLTIPAGLDSLSERLVGATLIVLAVYVLFVNVRGWRKDMESAGHRHISRSRVALLISAGRHAAWRAGRWMGSTAKRPDTFAFRYDRSSVFGVGMVHGLGAETPSQLLLFLVAANLGGASRGAIGLAAFLVGLLVMNTLMTASACGLFVGGRERPWLQTGLTSLTAVYSFCVGSVFLFGMSGRLPSLGH
jgi:high-affinity nickel-transport protein